MFIVNFHFLDKTVAAESFPYLVIYRGYAPRCSVRNLPKKMRATTTRAELMRHAE
jgi:hypothetical protein